MIKWNKYDVDDKSTHPPVATKYCYKLEKKYLVTDGENISYLPFYDLTAENFIYMKNKFDFYPDYYDSVQNVTHWAEINLPVDHNE